MATQENHAFIDGQNLHSGVRALGWKIDHKKFREYLRESFGVTKAFMFVGYMEEHQDLYNALQEAGFICFFKPLLRYDDGTIKGNVDADMVLQVMVDIENYEKAVIVTGDGDFAGLIRHLANIGKLGQVIIPNSRNYSSFFERMDEFGKDKGTFIFMDNLKNKLSYRPTRNYRNRSAASTAAAPKVVNKTSKTRPNSPARNSKPAAPASSSRRSTSRPKAAPAKSTRKPVQKRQTYKEKLESSLIETINNAADL